MVPIFYPFIDHLMTPSDLDQLATKLVSLTIKEVKDLTDLLKEKHGIVPLASAAPVAATSKEVEEQKEPVAKSSFDVILTSAGSAKLKVIKAVKTITELGLKQAKDLVDGAPKAVKTGLPKAAAEGIIKLQRFSLSDDKGI